MARAMRQQDNPTAAPIAVPPAAFNLTCLPLGAGAPAFRFLVAYTMTPAPMEVSAKGMGKVSGLSTDGEAVAPAGQTAPAARNMQLRFQAMHTA